MRPYRREVAYIGKQLFCISDPQRLVIRKHFAIAFLDVIGNRRTFNLAQEEYQNSKLNPPPNKREIRDTAKGMFAEMLELGAPHMVVWTLKNWQVEITTLGRGVGSDDKAKVVIREKTFF
jgi:hypothetical protein